MAVNGLSDISVLYVQLSSLTICALDSPYGFRLFDLRGMNHKIFLKFKCLNLTQTVHATH